VEFSIASYILEAVCIWLIAGVQVSGSSFSLATAFWRFWLRLEDRLLNQNKKIMTLSEVLQRGL